LAIIKGVSNPDLVLGGATYHLKKTKSLSEAQKEAMCIVNIVRGIELWSIPVSGKYIRHLGI
jgi:hypothetical protein